MTGPVYILNGPNLNLLGEREIELYGQKTLFEIEKECVAFAKKFDCEIRFFQSNHEGALIDLIHLARKEASGLLINPAGLGHSSISIYDALKSFLNPSIEVHLTNINKREVFRHHTYTSAAVDAVITGCGNYGYILGVSYLLSKIKNGILEEAALNSSGILS